MKVLRVVLYPIAAVAVVVSLSKAMRLTWRDVFADGRRPE